MSKVIHVHLIFEKKNIYFGSISAIFETLTEKQVGITKSSLLHAGLVDNIAKYTKRAMIIQSRLITCTRKGWNSLRTSIKPLFAAFFCIRVGNSTSMGGCYLLWTVWTVGKIERVYTWVYNLGLHFLHYKNETF